MAATEGMNDEEKKAFMDKMTQMTLLFVKELEELESQSKVVFFFRTNFQIS